MTQGKELGDDLAALGSEPNEVMSAALDLLAKIVDANNADLNEVTAEVLDARATMSRAGDLKGPCFKYDHGTYNVMCCKIGGRWICARHEK